MKIIVTLTVMIVSYTSVATPETGINSTQKENGSDWLYEIRAGLLAHDVDGLWSGSRKEGGVDINVEMILKHPSFSFSLGTVYPNFGLSINDHGYTSKLYGGLLYEKKINSVVYLNFGIGVAVHDGKLETNEEDKKELGSHILFRIPIEIGYMLNEHHRVSIAFDHVSNANLFSPNEGLDTFGLRYAYHF